MAPEDERAQNREQKRRRARKGDEREKTTAAVSKSGACFPTKDSPTTRKQRTAAHTRYIATATQQKHAKRKEVRVATKSHRDLHQDVQPGLALTDHPDGTSTETTGVVSCLERSLRMVSNGGLGSPLKPKPNIASSTTSYSPEGEGRQAFGESPHVASNTKTKTPLRLFVWAGTTPLPSTERVHHRRRSHFLSSSRTPPPTARLPTRLVTEGIQCMHACKQKWCIRVPSHRCAVLSKATKMLHSRQLFQASGRSRRIRHALARGGGRGWRKPACVYLRHVYTSAAATN